MLGPRERSPSLKNVAVGQAQLGPAIQVSASESAMDAPRHRGPAFVIARASQPGKFMSRPAAPLSDTSLLYARRLVRKTLHSCSSRSIDNRSVKNREDKGSPMAIPMKKEGTNEKTQRATSISFCLFACVWIIDTRASVVFPSQGRLQPSRRASTARIHARS